MKKLILSISIFSAGILSAQIYAPVASNNLTTNPTTGNVGIGIATPTQKLHVLGNAFIQGDIRGGDKLTFQDDARFTVSKTNIPSLNSATFSMPHYGIAVPSTGGSADLWVSGNNAIRMFSGGNPNPTVNILNGNMGIGTTNPQAKLDVNGGVNIANSQALRLSGNDENHGLRYKRNFNDGTTLLDGPFLYGWSGGSLGYKQGNVETHILNWRDNGNVGIGSTKPDEKLTVKGKIHAEEVRVDLAVPADYVFQKYYTGKSDLKTDYTMPTLAEVETYTKANNHLPNVPSAKEIQEKGLQLGEMTNLLLQKIEELTLYSIEQNKEIKKQNDKLDKLEKAVLLLSTK